ncbi:hypothetical protein CAEBREN_15231 [Caenorhabditis brenneri]|uniref:Uncharacterized protein n=1 Tax=Caenorhabditis brenneri TaxID=135651 RepID=G0PD25_CAEBE|nr:hypothetical protein CAEBREN_15231 [Caenorhabditis brenneri]
MPSYDLFSYILFVFAI